MKSTFIIICTLFLVSVLGSFIHDWERVSPASGSERVTFFVALNQRNIDQLEALLYSVSDPKSPSYGRQATEEEIASMVYPPREHHDLVRDHFLNQASEKIDIISYGDALKIDAAVSDVASIFGADFHWFHHVPSGHKAIRSRAINIPSAIRPYVHMITNLVSFPIIMKEKKGAKINDPNVVSDADFGYLSIKNIRNIYNIPPGTKVTNKGSSQCALEFTPEGAFSVPDLQQFCKLSQEPFYNYTQIVGPFAAGGWGNTESELDVQLLGTIGLAAENWFWTISDGWIYEMAVQIYNSKAKPWIFSISYGWPEQLTCGGQVVQSHCGNEDSADYISRANAELAKLGAMRITVIACSQDEGAPSSANEYCANTTHPIFGIYPGSSPFLTTVSSTSVIGNSSTGTNPPICSSDYPCTSSTVEHSSMPNNTLYSWATGGGFSEFTVAPTYQAAAIKSYFASSTPKPPTEYTWPKNRGYPDISAVGARILIIENTDTAPAEGTSASTPIIAGVATLLNDIRLNAGKTPLGFLNPMLYQMAAEKPATFNDITEGSNEYNCQYGYSCGTGWDPVTGLGTPNYVQMAAYVKTLP